MVNKQKWAKCDSIHKLVYVCTKCILVKISCPF